MKIPADIKVPLYVSVFMHVILLVLLIIDMPFLYTKPVKVVNDNVPLIIDLSTLKLAEKTNLPKKVEAKKKEVIKPAKLPKEPLKKPDINKPVPVPPAPSAAPKTKVQDEMKQENKADVKMVEDSKKADNKSAKKQEKKEKGKDQKAAIKSLLASVEKIKASIEEEKPTDKGVKDGKNGNYMQDLTISEKDAISAKMRECWNLDPGARDIGNMLVEVRVFLGKDGAVKDVSIADKVRYSTDSSFRAVAESARRAVYICGNKGIESPFYLLATRHPENYGLWREMVFFFNPLTGGVGG